MSRHKYALFLTIFSTFLFTLSFPSFLLENGISGLAAFALVPLFISFLFCKTYKQAAFLGAVFGLFSTLLTYYWLSRFQEYSIWTLSGTSMGYMGEYAIVGMVLYGVIHKCHEQNNFLPPSFSRFLHYIRPILLSLVWTAYEYIKSIGFLGFPWALLGHSVHQIDVFTQLARLTGVWGISFILCYINALTFEYLSVYMRGFSHRKVINKKKYLIYHTFSVLFVLVLVVVYGSVSLWKSRSIKPDTYISMVLIQQNLDSWISEDFSGTINNLEKIIVQTKNKITSLPKEESPELIVWSETSLRIPYQPGFNAEWDNTYTNYPVNIPFKTFLQENNIPLLSGTQRIDEKNPTLSYNSAVLIMPDGEVAGSYAKKQLVPLAEFIPFYSLPLVQRLGKLVGIYGTWAPGPSLEPITFTRKNGETFKIGTPICFEDGFSYISRQMKNRGADVFVNLTNVSWSRSITAQMQQFVAAKFRSIETGTSMARSTNSGVTSLIDPWGRVLARAPMFVDDTLYVEVPVYKNIRTLYLKIGDAFAQLVSVLVLGIVVLLVYIKKQESKKVKKTLQRLQ